MSLDILKGKSWWEISRDERYFCAELFRQVSPDIPRFVGAISSQSKVKLKRSQNWEMSVEVCFYRDFLRKEDRNLSKKRTFDICLFSETQVVIIEAKAHQAMPIKEARQAETDKAEVQKIFGPKVQVFLLALVSSRYKENHEKHSYRKPLDYFDGVISWKELGRGYGNLIFCRADTLYKD